MGHCRPAVIEKLRDIPDVVVKEGAAPLTVECETCAVSKMHKLVNRMPANRATKPFQILHFDLIILDHAWEGTTCIAHFVDEVSRYNWVFPLPNHLEKTLIKIFKYMINLCDRHGIPIGSVLIIFRTDQEQSIGNKLENLVTEHGIQW